MPDVLISLRRFEPELILTGAILLVVLIDATRARWGDVACRILTIPLIENRDYVRVANLVKDRGFTLKLLGEHLLKLGRRNSLQTTVQGFDDHSVSAVTIASNEHFGVTAGTNPTSDLIAILEDCSL